MTSERETRRVPWRLLIASLAAAVALAALGLSMAWRVSSGNDLRVETAKNCRQIEGLKEAISGVLMDGKATALQRADERHVDAAVRTAIEGYYDRQLARFAPRECPTP